MKNYFKTNRLGLAGIYALLSFLANSLSAQTITPQVFPAAGGYQVSGGVSLSYTLGETQIQTLVSSNRILTQGFQQPNELRLLHVKAFLQGYYAGGGLMNDVLFNQGVYGSPSTVADSITVALHFPNPPYAQAFQTTTRLEQNGSVVLKDFGVVGQSYFIAIRHRNSIETWSAIPIMITANTAYDFSDQATKAFGANQIEVESNVFAFYTGDINQDYAIDAFDYVLQDPDIITGAFGYLTTDLNGDGVADSFDYILLDGNLVNGVGAILP